MFKTFQQDQYLRYLWKDQGIPSTFGKEKSFLEYFSEQNNNIFSEIFFYQREFFGKKQEYGLLNRLDNDTGGFLYFAKTPLFYERYKLLQQEHKLQKTYIADVSGQRTPSRVLLQTGISGTEEKVCIERFIANHRHEKDRVVVISTEEDFPKYAGKTRGEPQLQRTRVEFIDYNPQTNISSLKVTINKGFRHQIRSHLASLGYTIVGDKVYNKKSITKILHLRSIGLTTESFFFDRKEFFLYNSFV